MAKLTIFAQIGSPTGEMGWTSFLLVRWPRKMRGAADPQTLSKNLPSERMPVQLAPRTCGGIQMPPVALLLPPEAIPTGGQCVEAKIRQNRKRIRAAIKLR